MTKIKITQEGQACRKCGTPVIKQAHDKPSNKSKAYWFAWWFVCPNCKTFYMVNAAKREMPLSN